MKDGGIKLSSVVVDGLDLDAITKADIDCFASFIKSEKMTAWFSFTSEASELDKTLPKDKLEYFATVAHLAASGNSISLAVLKNGKGSVNLDPKTLLFTK
jgi:hypothetical protein